MRLLLISLLLGAWFHAQAQTDAAAPTLVAMSSGKATNDTASVRELINKNREVLTRMSQIEVKLHQDEAVKVKTEGDIYTINRRRATATLNTFDAASACYDILLKSTIQAENQNVLSSISNPESNALGFKLTDVIADKIKSQLSQSATLNDKDRDKFVDGLSTLIGTVGSLLNPTSLVVQTVQSIASFLPGRVKDAAKDPTGKVFAEKFMGEMKPYLTYYDKLQKENDAYGTALSRLESKYRALGYELSNLDSENSNHRIQSARTTQANIDDIFETNAANQPNYDYSRTNQNDDVLYLADINTDVYSMTKQVLEFHREYSEIVNKHFKESLDLLDEAKTQFPGNNAAIEATKRLIVVPENDPTGFKRLLSIINNNLEDMRTRKAKLAVAQATNQPNTNTQTSTRPTPAPGKTKAPR